jgi:hypothetical protein
VADLCVGDPEFRGIVQDRVDVQCGVGGFACQLAQAVDQLLL